MPAYAAGDHGGDLRRYADVWAGGALCSRSIPLVCASLIEPAPRRFPLKRALWVIDHEPAALHEVGSK